MRALLTATAVVFIIGPAHAQQSQPGNWRTLSGAELQSLILTHKIGGINQYGEPFLVSYAPDGSVVAKAHPAAIAGAYQINQYSIVNDKGKWRITGDQLCTKMDNWLGAKENCFTLMTDGQNYRSTGQTALKPERYLDVVPWNGTLWTWR